MSSAKVNLLVSGLFMDWARHYQKVIKPVDKNYARKMFVAMGCAVPHEQDVRYAAALRCAVFWRLFKAMEPKDAALPYMFGVIIDSHVPLIATCESTPRLVDAYELYSTNQFVDVSPDNPHLSLPTTDEAAVPSHKSLEWLWKMDSTPIRHISSENIDLLKLLSKGAPRPVSIRYILSTIKKQLVPKPNILILNLLKTFIVGGWKHSTTIASPATRLKLASVNGIDYIITKISPPNLCSKELYTVIAEALYSYTRHHSAMYRVLKDDPAWPQYCKTIAFANNVVRPSIYKNKPPVRTRSASINLNHDVKASNTDKWNAFTISFGCNKAKIPQKVTNAVSNPGKMYQILEHCPYAFRFHVPTLEKMGFDACANLSAELQNLTRDKLQRVVNRLVAGLSKSNRAILYTYMHYVVYRSQLKITPLLCPVKRCAQSDHASDNSHLLYCGKCFTIRTQSRGEFERKSREGLLMDTMNRELYCSSCRSDTIIPVNCQTNMVIGYSVNSTSVRLPYSACCCCGEVTLIKKIVGTQAICTKCLKLAQKSISPPKCICGKEMISSKTTLVVKDNGGFKHIGLCNNHATEVFRLLGKTPKMPSLSVIKLILAHT